MSNVRSDSLHITPLTLWVAGAFGGALYAVLLGVAVSMFSKVSDMQENVTTLLTSQAYDRRELDALQSDLRALKNEVRAASERIGRIETR
jgi:hypothetical protein